MLLYADANGTKLPESEQLPAEDDTIYDMASLTKLYTTIAALRQIDAGKLDIYHTVASYLPAFAANGKENVTVLELLTHTSGFQPDPKPPLYYPVYPTYEDRVQAILNTGLINPPGSTYLYSDLNFMSTQLMLEHITGRKLDELIKEYTEPLGMHDTFFNRGNIEGPAFPPYPRMAAQEFQIEVQGDMEPKRPQPVRGTVHDENAWSLDGVAGHAGLFSTVEDTGVFCQMILNGGTYGGVRVLSPQAVDLIFHNFNTEFPGHEHGLGFELNQYYTAGPMASLQVCYIPSRSTHTADVDSTRPPVILASRAQRCLSTVQPTRSSFSSPTAFTPAVSGRRITLPERLWDTGLPNLLVAMFLSRLCEPGCAYVYTCIVEYKVVSIRNHNGYNSEP